MVAECEDLHKAAPMMRNVAIVRGAIYNTSVIVIAIGIRPNLR
jgi:hypothetical protein